MATLVLSPKQINQAISISVSRLLSHYATADLDPTARQLELEDWLGDLREFGPELVEDACNAYRRGPDYRRRPLPGDIRRSCIELQTAQQDEQRLGDETVEDRRSRREQRAARRKQLDEDMAREGREVSTRWAKERGFENLDAYAAAKGISYERACVNVCEWLLSHSTVAPVPGFRTGGATVGNYASEIVGGGFSEPAKAPVSGGTE